MPEPRTSPQIHTNSIEKLMTDQEMDTMASLTELLASQHTSSRGHGLMIKQAINPSDAVLYALDVLRGGDSHDRAESLAGLQYRIDGLVNVSTADAQRELAGHCVLLDELFGYYTVQALQARPPDVRVKLQKLAFAAQTAHARTLALVATLNAQQQGRARIILHDDAPDEDTQ